MSNLTEFTTGVARLSYEHLLKPSSINPDQPPKYSVTILLPKTDKSVAQMKAAVEQAKKEGIAKKWDGKLPPKVAVCIHDGDLPKESNGEPFGDECKGMWVFTASSSEDRKPQIVNSRLQPIMDPNEVYSGMWAHVAVRFFPYSFSGKKGIGCALLAVQKVKDDEPLGGGRVDVNKLFTSFDVDPLTGEVSQDNPPF
jgi:hypothetical protein